MRITHKTEEDNSESFGINRNNCKDPTIVNPEILTIACNMCVAEFTGIIPFTDHIENHTSNDNFTVAVKERVP